MARVGATSETTRTTSPWLINPLDFISWTDFEMLDSASSDKSTRRGTTPHCKVRAMRVLSSLVKAKMGGFGRLRDRSDAMCPYFVYTKMASTPRLLAAEQMGKFLL